MEGRACWWSVFAGRDTEEVLPLCVHCALALSPAFVGGVSRRKYLGKRNQNRLGSCCFGQVFALFRGPKNALERGDSAHCFTGCAIDEVLGVVIGTALGWGNFATIALAIVLAFFFGYLLTMLPLLRCGLAPDVPEPLGPKERRRLYGILGLKVFVEDGVAWAEMPISLPTTLEGTTVTETRTRRRLPTRTPDRQGRGACQPNARIHAAPGKAVLRDRRQTRYLP
jgi:hypothetical protein